MQKVKLNIVPKGVKKAAYLSQNDNGRVVRYELFNELVPYTLDGSETITVKVVRPDGEEIVSSVPNTEEAYIDVTFNDDMSAIAGVGAGEIKITDGETVLGSHNFDINVEIDAYNGKDVVIETEIGTLLSFNTEVEDNALEYESEIPYNAEGYTGLRVINSRTAPAYDKTPYLFRKTPSGYGNSCIEKLTGLTVAFNQLIQRDTNTTNGNLTIITDASTKKVTLNLSADGGSNSYTSINANTAIDVKINHKYIVLLNNYKENNAVFCIRTAGTWRTGSPVYDPLRDTEHLKTATILSAGYDGGGLNIMIDCRNPYTIPTAYPATAEFYPQVIDITQMFGSTIADYIYSLETAQAGAGVAYFKALFGADYYAYNAGELMSVKTSGRKTIGFNLFDKSQTVQGYYISDGNGAEIANVGACCTPFIRILPNTNYYIKSDAESGRWGAWYDADKNFISGINGIGVKQSPENACFMRESIKNNPQSTGNIETFCINISDPARDGEYEPYNAVTYPLDPDLELRGIPKLDANNKLYGDGDLYESNGDVTRRYGLLNLGSLDWKYGNAEGHKRFYLNRSDLPSDMRFPSSTSIANVLCKKYVTDTASHVYGNISNKTIGVGDSISEALNIMDLDYNDVPTFTASLNDVYLIYEKETPTSESADPFTDPQEARITEEFIDERSIPIPVAQDSIYGTDIEYQDIDFDTTIYGGEIDAVNGVLSSEYNSDGSVKPTPEIIDITPTPIPVRAGDNKIFNSANGNQTIRYYNQVEE